MGCFVSCYVEEQFRFLLIEDRRQLYRDNMRLFPLCLALSGTVCPCAVYA